MTIYIPPHIKVIVEGENGEIKHSQGLSDYFQKPSIDLQMAAHGSTLLDILIQEAKVSENLVLTHVFTGDAHADATRLIGSIAEALVVDLCNKNPEVNRRLGMYARFGQVPHQILDKYVAVATGSMRTRDNYQQHYNPNDTQRDIIWVEKQNTENQLLCIRDTTNASGKPAGLQVKASHNGVAYVVPSIKNYHYPILYFDLSGDWGLVQQALMQTSPSSQLIHADDLQHEMKHVLRGYFDIIVALLRNEITLHQVIEKSKHEGDSTLLSGLKSAEVNYSSKIILPSSVSRSN
ncbi:TPA: hypothetical protein N2705_004407 [Vibrio parahaemolyticus]|nr:hypothetical protein [Vibrio parahaemolyticus]